MGGSALSGADGEVNSASHWAKDALDGAGEVPRKGDPLAGAQSAPTPLSDGVGGCVEQHAVVAEKGR